MARDSSGISFTAFYTGEVWRRHGLSVDFLAQPQGRLLYLAGRPVERLAEAVLGGGNEVMLLQRHLIIDHLLERAVRDEGFTQVVEIACGLSPRGTLMARRFAAQDLHYIEADLPAMAARKRALLEDAGELGPRHRVLDLDILAQDVPHALEAVFAGLDPARKTLVITEGLVNYFDHATITGFWARLAGALRRFPAGLYLTDLYPNFQWHRIARAAQLFKTGLAFATRSRVTLHFGNEAAIRAGFHDAGFAAARVHLPESYYGVLPIPVQRTPSFVRVVENRIGSGAAARS
ncbi:MAG TPA: class I SAM-dependent methyltransferase [Moraxellaceae bacterium]|nr:class I SAM-dependent methyltransferase [Moraxellaceae bacterium]